MNVLISSAGRRVALLNIFREALSALGGGGKVVAADINPYASAFQAADDRFLVPRCTDAEFLPRLLEECRRRDIQLIVPTIDTELPIFARARAELAQEGITVAVSSPETIFIGADKVRTHEWLLRSALPTVRQTTLPDMLKHPADWPFPFIAKPKAGSSAIGVVVVTNQAELNALGEDEEYIVQQLAKGEEYTIDFWVDRHGTCRSAVPRKRLEVRAGEVSKAITIRRSELEEIAFAVADKLPGAYGVLNVQVFLDSATGECAIIEVNPRFGGGYPLAWQAGARYAEWLLRDMLDLPIPGDPMAWQAGLVMLRYDAAVFVEDGKI